MLVDIISKRSTEKNNLASFTRLIMRPIYERNIMNKEKIARIKKYVKTHAPELVTAVAAVGTLVVVVKDRMDRINNEENWRHGISKAKDEGWDYEFVPGIGLFIESLNKD